MVDSAHVTSRACHFEANELKFVKPSCNFHFWCLKQMENITFWGCKIFFKKIWVWNIKKPSILGENFLEFNFWKNNNKSLYFFISNLNLECFQLSFDMHIVHIDEKFWIWKNCFGKNEKISNETMLLFYSIMQKKWYKG